MYTKCIIKVLLHDILLCLIAIIVCLVVFSEITHVEICLHTYIVYTVTRVQNKEHKIFVQMCLVF